MSNRYIKKVLAGLEDLLIGPQTVEQQRGGQTVSVRGIPLALSVNHLKQIDHLPMIEGQVYFIGGKFPGQNRGGFFKYREDEPKENHDATNTIDPNRVRAWDGTVSDLGVLNYAAVTGEGCLVQLDTSGLPS